MDLLMQEMGKRDQFTFTGSGRMVRKNNDSTGDDTSRNPTEDVRRSTRSSRGQGRGQTAGGGRGQPGSEGQQRGRGQTMGRGRD